LRASGIAGGASGTLTEMESGFKLTVPGAQPPGWFACAIVLLLAIAHVFAVAHGVLTIDMARDLYWAQQIASGQAFPLFGPPVGSFEVLGPVWFYIAALAAKLATSLTSYFALLGALAALKYGLIWRVGLRWVDARFALWLVVAAAVPGIATYQLVGVGHPQLLELAIWTSALFALRLHARPDGRGDAMAVGLFAALALHAHPTAVLLLLPWLGVALLRLPSAWRWRAIAFAALGALLLFVPRIAVWLLPSLGHVTPDNAPAVSGLGGSFAGGGAILQNLFWYQPLYVVKTLVSARDTFVSTWQIAWTGVLLLTATGAVVALRDRLTRALTIAATLTMIAAALLLAALRDHTPFYMLYTLLPPFIVLFAASWYALQLHWPRFATPLVAVAAVVVVAAFAETVHGSIAIARRGLVESWLPLHSNMQDRSTTRHVESVHAVRQRDAVARWLCNRPPSAAAVALHGDLAVAVDVGVGLDFAFACPAAMPKVQIGGTGDAWIGMPAAAWQAAQIKPAVRMVGTALAPVLRVVAPLTPLPEVSGRTYPPRLATMIAGARREPWQGEFAADANDMVVVSSLLPTSPLFAASATAADAVVPPVYQFANTALFRCTQCGAGAVRWQVRVQGGLPETTSIVLLRAGDGATIAR